MGKKITLKGKEDTRRIIEACNLLKEIIPMIVSEEIPVQIRIKLSEKDWKKLEKISGGENISLAIRKIMQLRVDKQKAFENYLKKIEKGEKMTVFKEVVTSFELKDFKRFNLAEFYERIENLSDDDIEKLRQEVEDELEKNKHVVSINSSKIDYPFIKAISDATKVPVGTILKKTLKKYDEIERGLVVASPQQYFLLKVRENGDIAYYFVNSMLNVDEFFKSKGIEVLDKEKLSVKKVDYNKDLINFGFFLVGEKIIKTETIVKDAVYKVIDYSYNDLIEFKGEENDK